MSSFPHAALKGCKFLLEAAKATPKAAATASSKSKVKQQQGVSTPSDRRPTGILKNPMNKRDINCDHKLKTLFGGKDKVGFLEISKLLSPHFMKSN